MGPEGIDRPSDREADSAAFLSVVVRSTVKGNGVRIGLGWRGAEGGSPSSGGTEWVRVLLQSPVRPEVMEIGSGSDHRTKGTSQEPVQHSSSLNLACTEFLLCVCFTRQIINVI